MFKKQIMIEVLENERKDFIHFIYYTLLQNDRDKSPLVNAVRSLHTKAIEKMLEILLLNP